MSTITRSYVRHSAVETDGAKIAQLEAVAREWQRLLRWQVHQLRPAAKIGLAADPRATVKSFRASSERDQFTLLGSHLQQEAITAACGIVSAGWEQAAEKVRGKIARRRATGRVNEVEAHELNWLLRWPRHLAVILAGGLVEPTKADGSPVAEFAANDHARLDTWLHSALLRARPGQPRLRLALWFSVDAMTYSAREPQKIPQGKHLATRFPAWISLPTLTRGRPVRIPLAGAGINHLAEGHTLRVSIESDTHGHKRLVLRYALKIEVIPRTGGVVAGADKGITTVLTVTESDDRSATSHGTEYGTALTAIAKDLRRPNRGRIHSMAQKADQKTARHLLSHNLGSVKKDRRRRKAEVRLRQIHNQAIREAFHAHPTVSDLGVEGLGFVSFTDRGPTENRRLARWAKGQLQADLERISEANGVSLRVVNAAYSSQACPVCSWTERANRIGQVFRCRRCGYEGRADPVAASNLRSRISDAEIGRFTPYKVVKQILDRRAAERAEALGLPVMESEDHGAAPGMTTIRHQVESPTRETV